MHFFDAYKGSFFSIATALSWASAVIFFRLAGQKIKPIPLTVFRNTIALIFFGLTLWIANENHPHFSSYEWLAIAVSGILGITLGDVFYLASLNRIGASSQAIVDCLYSPTIMILAYLFFGEILTPMGLFGAALVIAAVFIGTMSGAKRNEIKNLKIGFLFGILAQLSMAFGIMVIRNLLKAESLLWINSYRYVAGNLFLILYVMGTKQTKETALAFKPTKTMRWTLPGSFLGSYAATLLWFMGFKHTLAGKAAIYNQLSTLFLILLAAIFLKEKLTPRKILAVLLGFCGAILVSWS